jgi:hypothetical protein
MNEDEDYMQEVICFGGSLDGMRKRVDVRNWCFKWAVYPKISIKQSEITSEPLNLVAEIDRYEILRCKTPRGTEYYIGEFVNDNQV